MILRTVIKNIKPYFQDENFALIYGDSNKILKDIPENSVDLIFADPPYLLSNGGFTVHAGKRVSVNKGEWDKSKGVREDFKFHQEWIANCKRVLKPEGTIWISGTYHSIYACGLALQVLGYKILNDIAWYKPNAAPNLSGRYFTASHETLLWAKKDPGARHYFDYNYARSGSWREDFLKAPGKQMRSVWAINPPAAWEKKFGKHPTQKPFDLLKRIILLTTKPSDIVLDPFTGSSTTGIAAEKYARNFIGIDTEKDYLDLSIQRFKDLQDVEKARPRELTFQVV